MGMTDVPAILARWGSRQQICEDLEVPYTTVASWHSNKRIPAWRHAALLASAKRRGIDLTLEELAQAHISPSSPPPSLREAS